MQNLHVKSYSHVGESVCLACTHVKKVCVCVCIHTLTFDVCMCVCIHVSVPDASIDGYLKDEGSFSFPHPSGTFVGVSVYLCVVLCVCMCLHFCLARHKTGEHLNAITMCVSVSVCLCLCVCVCVSVCVCVCVLCECECLCVCVSTSRTAIFCSSSRKLLKFPKSRVSLHPLAFVELEYFFFAQQCSCSRTKKLPLNKLHCWAKQFNNKWQTKDHSSIPNGVGGQVDTGMTALEISRLLWVDLSCRLSCREYIDLNRRVRL
jgi:hypothetical protein